MKECLFCSIVEAKTALIWENETVAAFRDKFPSAPVHILIVPKVHIDRLSTLNDEVLAGQLLIAAVEVAVQEGVAEAFQLLTNNGRGAGQIIDHLHFHLKADVQESSI